MNRIPREEPNIELVDTASSLMGAGCYNRLYAPDVVSVYFGYTSGNRHRVAAKRRQSLLFLAAF